jgi:hypothetical protein
LSVYVFGSDEVVGYEDGSNEVVGYENSSPRLLVDDGSGYSAVWSSIGSSSWIGHSLANHAIHSELHGYHFKPFGSCWRVWAKRREAVKEKLKSTQ